MIWKESILGILATIILLVPVYLAAATLTEGPAPQAVDAPSQPVSVPAPAHETPSRVGASQVIWALVIGIAALLLTWIVRY